MSYRPFAQVNNNFRIVNGLFITFAEWLSGVKWIRHKHKHQSSVAHGNFSRIRQSQVACSLLRHWTSTEIDWLFDEVVDFHFCLVEFNEIADK